MVIKNTVSIDFLSTFLDSIGVFDCSCPAIYHFRASTAKSYDR